MWVPQNWRQVMYRYISLGNILSYSFPFTYIHEPSILLPSLTKNKNKKLKSCISMPQAIFHSSSESWISPVTNQIAYLFMISPPWLHNMDRSIQMWLIRPIFKCFPIGLHSYWAQVLLYVLRESCQVPKGDGPLGFFWVESCLSRPTVRSPGFS